MRHFAGKAEHPLERRNGSEERQIKCLFIILVTIEHSSSTNVYVTLYALVHSHYAAGVAAGVAPLLAALPFFFPFLSFFLSFFASSAGSLASTSASASRASISNKLPDRLLSSSSSRAVFSAVAFFFLSFFPFLSLGNFQHRVWMINDNRRRTSLDHVLQSQLRLESQASSFSFPYPSYP